MPILDPLKITRQDTDGVRSILEVGDLAVDNYANGEDVGRIWTGNGDINKALAFVGEGVAAVNGKIGSINLSKSDVGLTNVDNTSDIDKPISLAVHNELEELRTLKDTNEPNGYVRERPASMGVMELHAADGLVHRIDQHGVYTVRDSSTWFDGTPAGEHQFRIMPTAVGVPFEVWQQGVRREFQIGQTIQVPSDGRPCTTMLDIINEGTENEYAEFKYTVVIEMDFFEENPITAWIQLSEDGQTVVQFGDERHGISMSGATHYYLHMTEGSRYHSGLGIQGLTVGGTTHGTCEAGALFDEDIMNNLPNCDTIRWMYREGSSWTLSDIDANVALVVNSVAHYNKYDSTTAVWSLEPLNAGEYTYVFYLATNNKLSCFVKLTSQTVMSTLKDAQDGLDSVLTDMNLQGLPSPEMLVCGAWIVNADGKLVEYHGNTHIDLRQQRISGAAGSSGVTTDHKSLTHTDDIDSHPATAISIDIAGHSDVANVNELGVDLYSKLDAIAVSNMRIGTTDEVTAMTPIYNGEIVYSTSEARHVYWNHINNEWAYLDTNKRIQAVGEGEGRAGTWVETWAVANDATTNWISDEWGDLNDGQSTGRWNRHRGTTGSSGTGPSAAYSGTYYVYSEMSSSGHATQYNMDTANFKKLTELTFKYHMHGTGCGWLKVVTISNGVENEIWSVGGNQGNQWNSITLDMHNTNAEVLSIRYEGSTSYRADLALDQIEITSI